MDLAWIKGGDQFLARPVAPDHHPCGQGEKAGAKPHRETGTDAPPCHAP